MRLIFSTLFILMSGMVDAKALESKKNGMDELPKDIRFDVGSNVVLIQHLNKISDLDSKFPVILQQSCKPKVVSGKIQSLDCKIINIDYVEKK